MLARERLGARGSGGVMQGWTRKESGRGGGRDGKGLTAGWALACAGPLSVRLGLAGGGVQGTRVFRVAMGRESGEGVDL